MILSPLRLSNYPRTSIKKSVNYPPRLTNKSMPQLGIQGSTILEPRNPIPIATKVSCIDYRYLYYLHVQCTLVILHLENYEIKFLLLKIDTTMIKFVHSVPTFLSML